MQGGAGDFVGPGAVDGQPAFYKEFVVGVPAAGIYEVALEAGDIPEPESARVTVQGCRGVASGILSLWDGTENWVLLAAGRHSLVASFPPDAGLRGEMSLSIRYISPPPS